MTGFAIPERNVVWLRRSVRRWFAANGRDFPWRRSRVAYEILVAELLLQRTRADLVPAAYRRFLVRYPDAWALAAADVVDVVDMLRPLGFLHRSARLPELGRALVERFEGQVPETETELLSLPGVGPYVANAVLLLAFDRPRPLLDPNVIRLLYRAFGIGSTRSRPREDRRIWDELQRTLPSRAPRPVALGLIDLGATVCLTRRPRCHSCPLRRRCIAFQTGSVQPRQES